MPSEFPPSRPGNALVRTDVSSGKSSRHSRASFYFGVRRPYLVILALAGPWCSPQRAACDARVRHPFLHYLFRFLPDLSLASARAHAFPRSRQLCMANRNALRTAAGVAALRLLRGKALAFDIRAAEPGGLLWLRFVSSYKRALKMLNTTVILETSCCRLFNACGS